MVVLSLALMSYTLFFLSLSQSGFITWKFTVRTWRGIHLNHTEVHSLGLISSLFFSDLNSLSLSLSVSFPGPLPSFLLALSLSLYPKICLAQLSWFIALSLAFFTFSVSHSPFQHVSLSALLRFLSLSSCSVFRLPLSLFISLSPIALLPNSLILWIYIKTLSFPV